MNNNFNLIDKNTNTEKKAQMIVKFNVNDNDYLVYCVDENEQNSQIFVSKLILNSEGKNFIDDISVDEKSKLSNIVYNIVIMIPSDCEKGSDFHVLTDNLFNKFSVKLLNDLPILDNQEYYNNCSIAITSKILVDNAIKLYKNKLSVVNEHASQSVPTWTAPLEVTAPTPVESNINTSVQEPIVVASSIPVNNSVDLVTSNNNVEVKPDVINNVATVNQIQDNQLASVSTPVDQASSQVSNASVNIMTNSSTEKVAVVSDPSLGIGVQQTNITDNKNAGFTNTKYVVIGTSCLVLSILVIVIAYFLISNIS